MDTLMKANILKFSTGSLPLFTDSFNVHLNLVQNAQLVVETIYKDEQQVIFKQISWFVYRRQ